MSAVQRCVLVVSFLIPLAFSLYFYKVLSEPLLPPSTYVGEDVVLPDREPFARLVLMINLVGAVGLPIGVRLFMYGLERKAAPIWLYVAIGSVMAAQMLLVALGLTGVL